jgi:hypothetical protein
MPGSHYKTRQPPRPNKVLLGVHTKIPNTSPNDRSHLRNLGTHPITGDQLFLVIAGSGWVAGADGIRHPVQAGQGAHWAAGEVHTSGTHTSLTALAVEGSSLRLFEPEHS